MRLVVLYDKCMEQYGLCYDIWLLPTVAVCDDFIIQVFSSSKYISIAAMIFWRISGDSLAR